MSLFKISALISLLILIYSQGAAQFNQLNCSDFVEYTVKFGDTLKSISAKFGSSEFKDLIIYSNRNSMSEADGLSPGQILNIPYKIFHFNNSGESIQSVLLNPYCGEFDGQFKGNFTRLPTIDEDTTDTSNFSLEEFRSAFEEVIKQKEKSNTKNEDVNQDPVLNFDALVLDETRSKMGRDFYELFYQKWKTPPEASDITLTITEQPSPGLGSVIIIKLDYDQVFSVRLQPRYEYIEAVSQQAVTECYNIIQNQLQVRKQLTGY